jgi:hypothetical protein
MTRLQAAARRLLDLLHDDHEDCHICYAPEGHHHDRAYACGGLEEALRKEIRRVRR